MNAAIPTFFTHSLYIERTVNNESLPWNDWLIISAASKRIRQVVLSIRPFQVFVLGGFLIKKYSEGDSPKDYRMYLHLAGHIQIMKASIGDVSKLDLSTFLYVWTDQRDGIALALAKSRLDRANEKIKLLVGDEHFHGQGFLSTIKHIAEKKDEQSLEFALELAEMLRSDTLAYSEAVRNIALAILVNPTKAASMKVEQLIEGIEFYGRLPVECQLAVAKGEDFKLLISNYLNHKPADPMRFRFRCLYELIKWRLSQKDSDAVNHCLEISCYALNLTDFQILLEEIYHFVVDNTNNSQDVERLQHAIDEIGEAKYGDQYYFIANQIFNYKREKLNLCKMLQSSNDETIQQAIQTIDRMPVDEQIRLVSSVICDTFKSEINPKNIAYAMKLSPYPRSSCIYFLINKLSTPVLLNLGKSMSFISDMYKLVNTDDQTPPPSWGQMMAHIVMNNN